LKWKSEGEKIIQQESNRASIRAGGIEKYEDPEFLEAGTDVIKQMLKNWFSEIWEDWKSSENLLGKTKKKSKRTKDFDQI